MDINEGIGTVSVALTTGGFTVYSPGTSGGNATTEPNTSTNATAGSSGRRSSQLSEREAAERAASVRCDCCFNATGNGSQNVSTNISNSSCVLVYAESSLEAQSRLSSIRPGYSLTHTAQCLCTALPNSTVPASTPRDSSGPCKWLQPPCTTYRYQLMEALQARYALSRMTACLEMPGCKCMHLHHDECCRLWVQCR